MLITEKREKSITEPDLGSTGYLSQAYASSFGDLGKLTRLSRSGAWLVIRQFEANVADAASLYPLFCSGDAGAVVADLEDLAHSQELVSITLVTDPTVDMSLQLNLVQSGYFDIVRPYKTHFIADLNAYSEAALPATHRRHLRACRQKPISVKVCTEALSEELKTAWCEKLYPNLIARHAITGMAAFSASALLTQLSVPGLVTAYACSTDNDTDVLGMCVFYVCGDTAYYHLGAYSDTGYQTSCSYAIFDAAFTYLRNTGVSQVFLGSGAGIDTASDGLLRFKSGWATRSAENWILGKICSRQDYERLSVGKTATTYFPSYRNPTVCNQ
jgi:hypothetical protein